MSTQTPALPFPVTPRRRGGPEADLTGFTLMHRALRSGTRMLAEAADGIARDDVCDRSRQRGIVEFPCAVLTEVRAHLEREDAALWRLVVVSADERADLAPLSADHAELERCRTRRRAATSTSRLLFLAPWVADQCHPAELGTCSPRPTPAAGCCSRLARSATPPAATPSSADGVDLCA